MKVTCPCGTTFDARHPRAKFCSDRCRKRHQRTGTVVPIDQPAPAEDAERPTMRPIEAAAYRELEEAGRLDSMLGQACLALARRLDMPGLDTGSAVASVTKELRSMMGEATKGAGKATAPQSLADELAARRARQGA